MNVDKKMIFTELNGKIKQYFEELKENTGLNNSGVIRYAIIQA